MAVSLLTQAPTFRWTFYANDVLWWLEQTLCALHDLTCFAQTPLVATSTIVESDDARRHGSKSCEVEKAGYTAFMTNEPLRTEEAGRKHMSELVMLKIGA